MNATNTLGGADRVSPSAPTIYQLADALQICLVLVLPLGIQINFLGPRLEGPPARAR